MNTKSVSLKVFLLLLMFPTGLCAKPLGAQHIDYGLNNVDLGVHNSKSIAVYAKRNNNNAHSFSVLTLYLTIPDTENNALNIISIFDKEAKESFFVKVGGGADCVLDDFRLTYPEGKTKRAELIIGHRNLSNSYFEAGEVYFDFYRLVENQSNEIGRPKIYFQYIHSNKAGKIYFDVEDAFQEELGL